MSSIAKTPEAVTDPVVNARIDALIKGSVDLHCHSGPSVMARSVDHIEALEEAGAAGMRALLFKDHYYSATPVTELLQGRYKRLGVQLLSGVPLNDTCGGLNPYAVDHGLKLGARVIWMPTFSAANHIRESHRRVMLQTKVPMMAPSMLTVVDVHNRIKDEVKVILDQIAEFDAVLSTGHLHISEIWPLLEEAKKRGVKRRLVQHPTYTIGASLGDISKLTADGTYVEHSLCMYIEGSRFQHWNAEELKEVILAGGVEQTILGSDLGQIKNPTPVTGFRAVIKVCMDQGFSDDDIRKLVGLNAARLMDLDGAGKAAS
jgi:hypothetical protein